MKFLVLVSADWDDKFVSLLCKKNDVSSKKLQSFTIRSMTYYKYAATTYKHQTEDNVLKDKDMSVHLLL
jgi:hypothetical protein